MSVETEFKITRSVDGLYDVFYPFGLRVDWSESKMQYAPEITIDRQQIEGADTDVLFDAKYGVRGLKIVAYSPDGYTKTQLESLKALISTQLNTIQTQDTKLLYYDTGYVNISLSGLTFVDNIQTGFLKVTFNFTLTNPYNYLIKTLATDGNIVNSGLYNCKPKITITGAATNPAVTYNGNTLTLGITLLTGESAIIFCDLYKAYKYDSVGAITDVTNYITGNYFDFLKGTYAIASNYPTKTTYEWHEKYLWGTSAAICDTYPTGYDDTNTIYIKDGKIYPFDLFIKGDDSEMPIMPEVQLETIANGDSDGVSVSNTKYTSRNFKISCYSSDGLTYAEKNTLSQKVLNTIDTMRNTVKTLYFVDANSKFRARINSNIDAENHPGFLSFTLGFETVSAYSEKDVTLTGSTATNNGIVPCGFVVTFPGAVTNPSITVGGVEMAYVGEITSSLSLVIDTAKKLCYTLDSSGNKVNVKKNYNGNYPLLGNGDNTVSSTSEFTMTWKEKYLWGAIYGSLPIIIEESDYQALIDANTIDENKAYYVFPDGTIWQEKYYWYLMSNKLPIYNSQSEYDALGESIEEDRIYIATPA